MKLRVDSLARLYVLLLLQGGKKHGYELIKLIRERTGKTVSPGQIYPFLKKLEKLGYVKGEQGGGREKKSYNLTKTGRIFSGSLLRKVGMMLELAITEKLKTCAHCGCEVYRGSYSAHGKHFCCRNCAAAYAKSE